MYCLIVLESRSWRSRYWPDHVPFYRPMEVSVPHFSPSSLVVCWQSMVSSACRHITPISIFLLIWHFSMCMAMSKFLLFIETPVILNWRPILPWSDLILTNYIYNNPISKWVHILWYLGFRTSIYEFRGIKFNPYRWFSFISYTDTCTCTYTHSRVHMYTFISLPSHYSLLA